MKSPNGYGSVSKLSGNRRRPFVVRKTKGFDLRGYPVYETIGYYETREDGLIALAQFNKDPYDIQQAKITLEELFSKWSERAFPKISQSLASSTSRSSGRIPHIFRSSIRLLVVI